MKIFLVATVAADGEEVMGIRVLVHIHVHWGVAVGGRRLSIVARGKVADE